MLGFLRNLFAPKNTERDTTLRESEDAKWSKFIEQEGVTYEISPRVECLFMPTQLTVCVMETKTHAGITHEFEPADVIWKIYSDHKTYQYYSGKEVCRDGWFYIEREKTPLPLEIIESVLDCGMAIECLNTRFQFPILVKEEQNA